MNLRTISRNVGFALLVSALFMFFSILVSVAGGNDSALAALSVSFILTFTVGIFPFIFVRKAPEISLTDGYCIIVLSWLLSFVFGMMPYLLWGGPFTVINAFFESVSGFTTTGATILESVEDLPRSLLFWRSSTNFIGGLGVVVFLLLIIPASNPIRLRLAHMEISSLSKENYPVRINKTVLIFTSVYLVMNLAAFLCYWAAGMTPFEAVNHAFSACATGGFSTRNASIGAFHSLPLALVSMLFMYLASIHFGLIYFAVVTHSFKPLRHPVLKFYNRAILLAILIVTLSLKFGDGARSWGSALLDGSFHAISYISTTGLAISDNAAWPVPASVTLLVFILMCGCAGSTTGGIKADRVLILFRAIKNQVRRAVHPTYVENVKVGNHLLSEEEMAPHLIFIAMYVGLALCSLLLCLFFGAGLSDSIAGTVATLGNVGPGTGSIGTFGNYNAQPAMVKFIFTMDMFLGRLEIYPVLAVLPIIFGKNRR